MTARPSITGCRLSSRARIDLAEIWRYTARRWSVTQADAYIDSFDDTLRRIVDAPFALRERTELRIPVRIALHEAHLVIYRIEPPNVLVDRIIHGRWNWPAILDGE